MASFSLNQVASRGRLLRLIAGAAAVAAGTIVYATPVAPGGTLDPVPSAFLPTGSTLEHTIERDFDFTLSTGFPLPNHLRGTIQQYIYRLPDNTIAFSYRVVNHENSRAAVTDLYVRDFDDYTTDIFQALTFQGSTVERIDEASRTIDGAAVRFGWDLGVAVPGTSNIVTVRTNATAYAYSTGRFHLFGHRATICTGNECFNLSGLAYPVDDSTPPVVSITGPSPLQCVCNPAVITGLAHDPSGLDNYILEHAPAPGGPWTEFASSTTAVATNGPLASWNTTSVPQGYHFIRLTATNAAGLTSSVTSVVFVDKQFDTVDVRSPQAGAILGGTVCFDGSVGDANSSACFNNYTLSYAPLPAGAPFLPVNPLSPTYTTAVINDGLGSWNTRTGPASAPDGSYRVRVTGVDDCGHSKTVTRDVVIDNTPPVAQISSPAACVAVAPGAQIQIEGQVFDEHLAGWSLQYTGGEADGWVTIASGSSNVSGVLATWNTAGLEPCSYTLRLLAGDGASVSCGATNNQAEHLVSIKIGCPADANGSGEVTVQDLFDYLTAYFAGCP